MSSTLTQVTVKRDTAKPTLEHAEQLQQGPSMPNVSASSGTSAPSADVSVTVVRSESNQKFAAPSAGRHSMGSIVKAHAAVISAAQLPNKLAPSLVWRSWPLVDDAAQQWPVLGATIAAAAISGLALGSYAVFGLVLAVQWLALWRLLLPVEYELTERGIRQSVLGRTVRVSWSTIRRCQVLTDGVFLSPDAEPGPFASLRGRFIPWKQHRVEILAAVNKLAGHSNSGTAFDSTTAGYTNSR